MEAKKISSISELKDINWSSTLPAKNRTIIRMLTISSGVFMSVDMADAAIRAAISSGGSSAKFFTSFIVRVNFVGVGRFAIAVGCDFSMGVKKSRLEDQRSSIKSQMAYYKNAKVYYVINGEYKKALDTEIALVGLKERIKYIEEQYENTISDMDSDSRRILASRDGFARNNRDVMDEINRVFSEV